MSKAEIRETIVTPDASGTLVQLQISDVPLPAEDAAIRITLAVRVPEYRLPLLAHLQREAMRTASAILRDLTQDLGSEIQDTSYDLSPTPKR